jgi:hypothetical protein
MRLFHRLTVLASLLAFAAPLAGCADFDVDKLDIFHLTDKKKLPGERRELFPGGVPGVTQGVPPEYMQGYQPPPDQSAEALPPGAKVNPVDEDASAALKPESKTAAVEPVEPVEKPKPKPKRKPKPKPVTAQRAPAQITIQPANAAKSPWPATPSQAQQQPAQGPWPDPKKPPDNTAWPAPPPPGTFSQ